MSGDADFDSSLAEGDRELLRDALARGYFDVPRRVSVVRLAEDHEMTDREAMYRLQTELSDVLTERLTTDDDE